ncbi:unnamed protein product, partial [marine sediment metagenome]
DWKNKYMRLQAEFENAQKRWNKNRQNLRIEYTASALKTFLPLYDSFKKALENSDENQVILKGFFDQFINILKYHKALPIDVFVCIKRSFRPSISPMSGSSGNTGSSLILKALNEFDIYNYKS